MTFYLLFLFAVTLLAWLAKQYNKFNNVALIVMFVIALMLSGFREDIGADFGSYVDWYRNKTRDDSFEFGYLLVMKCFRLLHLNYHALFFFFSFATLFFVFLAVKKQAKNSALAFLFYLMVPAMFLSSLTTIRESFAVAISFYAFYFLIAKKLLEFCVLMIIGLSIHYTAIVPFIIFLLVYKFAGEVKTIHLAVLLVVSLVLAQLEWFSIVAPLFKGTHYMYYFHTEQLPFMLFKVLVRNSVAIFLLFYFNKMKNKYPNQKFYIVLSFIAIIIVNMFSKYVGLIRLSHYFVVFQILFFADVLYLEVKQRRLLLFACIYGYGFSLFIHSLRVDYQIGQNGSNYIPYNSVFYKFDDPFFMKGTKYLLSPQIENEAD